MPHVSGEEIKNQENGYLYGWDLLEQKDVEIFAPKQRESRFSFTRIRRQCKQFWGSSISKTLQAPLANFAAFFKALLEKAIQIQCFNILKYAEKEKNEKKEKSLNRFVQRWQRFRPGVVEGRGGPRHLLQKFLENSAPVDSTNTKG